MTDFHTLIDSYQNCACGQAHECAIRDIEIGSGLVSETGEILKKNGFGPRLLLAADEQTLAAADGIEASLSGFTVLRHIWPSIRVATMQDVEKIEGYFDRVDGVLAVGTGSVHDPCRLACARHNVPLCLFATAPSMDGFASNASSMVVDGVKLTLYNRCPQAIVLDTEVLAQAPMRMLWAGLGDMVAKYISVCEWRIAHIVIEEYYCEHVAQLMRNALKRIMAAADHLAERDPDSVGAVAEGLVLSGFAMSFAKVSRPASGLEHYFSHMWEMMALERGHEADLHGIQVGVGTVLTMNIYEDIKRLQPSREKAEAAMKAFDPAAWEARVRRVFGKTAPQVLAIEEKAHKNDPARHAVRLTRILDNWDEIQKIIREELPDREWLFGKMKQTGMPMTPEELGISHEDVVDAFVCSRDIRDKYLSGSMLWDLGELDDFAKRL